MVEANPSLARSQRQAQRQAERMRIAVRVEAQRRAREEVKAKIRREGRVKLASVPSREITAQAEARLLEDVEYRAKLIAEAKAVVERWQWGHVVGCTQLETSEQFARACDARASIERISCTVAK
jgi:hypothetical protein